MRIVGLLSLAALSVGLSGCITTGTESFGARSSREQAAGCIRKTHDYQYRSRDEWRSGRTAPQIMTYDPNSKDQTTLTQTDTGVEVTTRNDTQSTRLKTADDKFSFSANNGKSTAVGIKGTTKESNNFFTSMTTEPELCREAGPGDEISPTIVGAVIGAAAAASPQKTGEAAAGVIVGGYVGSKASKGN